MRCKQLGVVGPVVALAGIVGAQNPSVAQVLPPFPFEIEGPMSNAYVDEMGNRVITVMGSNVRVPEGTPIHSPTADVDFSELTAVPFPGRIQAGFLGGTAIILGETENGVAVATDVFVEPAENVVLGEVTENSLNTDGTLKVQHIPVEFLTDTRMPASPSLNAYGFEIDVGRMAVGTPASIEGYFSNNGSPVFHAFLLEAEDAPLLNENIAEVSVLRADCQAETRSGEDELQVSGATHTPASGTVRVLDANAPYTDFGTATVVADADNPDFGSYRFRRRDFNLPNNLCPTEIRVVFVNQNADAVGPVEVEFDEE